MATTLFPNERTFINDTTRQGTDIFWERIQTADGLILPEINRKLSPCCSFHTWETFWVQFPLREEKETPDKFCFSFFSLRAKSKIGSESDSASPPCFYGNWHWATLCWLKREHILRVPPCVHGPTQTCHSDRIWGVAPGTVWGKTSA